MTAPRTSRLRAFFSRWLARLGILLLGMGCCGLATAGLTYKRLVVDDPAPHTEHAAVMAVISEESPVLYSDRVSRIGVFFSSEHREYVPYDRIPRAWVDAIVAAEDQRFFDHHGVDVLGITRAMVANVQARRLVAGGSTLTQQTAKNLYYRADRSLRSKWDELVDALRLERRYEKGQILEFYANQFHVSANGRGLGIAARYFFDKDVEQLDTLECAFLAGLVKGPANYNPFIGRTQERRDRARHRAHLRTRYVLDRMLDMGSLTADEHAALIVREIPFKRGRFRYESSVLIDAVAERLESQPFPALFADLGIENPSTAGIQVVTTLDRDAQREATWAMWHHLSEVGPLLEGVPELRLPDSRASSTPMPDPPARHTFHVARITGRTDDALIADVGGHPCEIDAPALEHMARIVARGRTGDRRRGARSSDVTALREALPDGAVVWVSVRDPELCDLEVRPELQGASVLLEKGRIRALVGGNDNRNFNRATSAYRQLGSTWKPLVYAAALQLGWTPDDVLDNRLATFHFETVWYWPGADHNGEDAVSLAWAGTRSENVASIWLLVHLIDRLDETELMALAARVGLARGEDEARSDYIRRVRDDDGVISTASRRPQLAFVAARQDVLGTLDDPMERLDLQSLLYGRGVDRERAAVRSRLRGDARQAHLDVLDHTYTNLAPAATECRTQLTTLRDLVARGKRARLVFDPLKTLAPPPSALPAASELSALSVQMGDETLAVSCGRPPASEDDDPAWLSLDDELLAEIAAGLDQRLIDDDEIRVDGRLRLVTMEALMQAAALRESSLSAVDPYDLESLIHHPDFRALLSMRAVTMLAKTHGIDAAVPPVLSMPLGAVDITLVEAASLYESLISGRAWSFPGSTTEAGETDGLRRSRPVDSPEQPTQLISEIRDRFGNVLYRAEPAGREVAPSWVGPQVRDVLENVVRWGTGRRANGAVKIGNHELPLAGKTGTTNGFRNAAFCGWIPQAGELGWSWRRPLTLAVYVGYDDNRPMARGRARLAGSSGALPAWIYTARGLAESGVLGEPAAGWVASGVMADGPEFGAVPVEAKSGLRAEPGQDTEGRSVLIRRGAQRGDDAEALRGVEMPFTPAG